MSPKRLWSLHLGKLPEAIFPVVLINVALGNLCCLIVQSCLGPTLAIAYATTLDGVVQENFNYSLGQSRPG